MREVKTCANSRVVHTRLIMPSECNSHGNLFGGHLMAEIDKAAAISFIRHGNAVGMTASMDSLNFLKPLPQGHSVTIETIVSGVGSTSAEVFAEVVGEDLKTGERYLAATAFLTFVSTEFVDGERVQMPALLPETEEELYIHAGYPNRKKARLKEREIREEFNNKLISKHHM
ncbi:acyl-CoA thioesterase [Hutsoniella sourekii]|uniref:acyl-CoA thioesterase n=1 Tax=Hutsoniella sourekii TaxID=87650 RepID=UPI000488976D|nr:acyl-CoA thioesterase [Hutsoniella sourekii]